jgi:hypothetical protein
MPMKPYLMKCYTPGCAKPAQYKVAARWSDGVTHELKTYSLCCESCLPAQFAEATARRSRCRLTDDETLEKPTVFELVPETRYRFLNPRPDLEAILPNGG